MNRRHFLKTVGFAATAGVTVKSLLASTETASNSPMNPVKDTRHRGFNLTEMASPDPRQPSFSEADFALMQEWGFNYARLPLSYWCWSRPTLDAWETIDERAFSRLDRGIELGRSHGIHVNVALHRIPGYCINGGEKEPLQLFGPAASPKALEVACHHWRVLARRYRGIPSSELSFDLLNEPPLISGAEYAHVCKALVDTIRAEDPSRVIVADGINAGRIPCEELVPLGLVQSGRGYDPMRVSHDGATWVRPEDWEGWPKEVSWPIRALDGTLWDKEMLRQKMKPWKDLEARGVRIHIGEWGAYNQTKHPVVLAWMRDQLSLWKEAGWGWSMWNLRGAFGPIDSGRPDVVYENFRGMKLDRKMIDLLMDF